MAAFEALILAPRDARWQSEIISRGCGSELQEQRNAPLRDNSTQVR
jgi:hypothetical protein